MRLAGTAATLTLPLPPPRFRPMANTCVNKADALHARTREGGLHGSTPGDGTDGTKMCHALANHRCRMVHNPRRMAMGKGSSKRFLHPVFFVMH